MFELSERNVRVLLSKLDRRDRGEETACTIIKGDGTVISATEDTLEYNPNSRIFKIARWELHNLLLGNHTGCLNYGAFQYRMVPDSVAYANRQPGEMHPSDLPCGGAR